MFLIFLFVGSFTMIDFSLEKKDALIVDVFLSIVFFLQHSVMVRRGFKKRLKRFMPDIYHSAFYGITSAVTLLLVLVFWQKIPVVLAGADGIIFWLLRVLFVLCLAGFYWGAVSIGSFDALGVMPLMTDISNAPDSPPQVTAKGPYRWVRHPMYFFMILIIWSCPVLTPDRLLFNITWSVWMVVATYLEDKDLHREFGSRYAQYSSKVPMLIPCRIPKQ